MPLNAFVVLLLLKIKFLSPKVVFWICTIAHGISFLGYLYFYISTQKTGMLIFPLNIVQYLSYAVCGNCVDYSHEHNEIHDLDDDEITRDPEIQREIQRSMNRMSSSKKDQTA